MDRDDSSEQSRYHSKRIVIMDDVSHSGISRSQGSFANLMAIANEEGFPLTDRELNSDSDSDSDTKPAAPYTTTLDAVTEINKGENFPNGIINIIDHGTPKYCRDPDAPLHSECYNRIKDRSYAHTTADAALDFSERFCFTHDGGDSTAYYRNWSVLKWKCGERLVHGNSSLRGEVVREEGYNGGGVGGEVLLGLIEEEYGPLTRAAQSSRVSMRSETQNSLIEGVAGLNDDGEAAQTSATTRSPVACPWSEETLMKVSHHS